MEATMPEENQQIRAGPVMWNRKHVKVDDYVSYDWKMAQLSSGTHLPHN